MFLSVLYHQGQVKMCDFGISAQLVDSVAKTMNAGCEPYMAVSTYIEFRNSTTFLHFIYHFYFINLSVVGTCRMMISRIVIFWHISDSPV